MFSFLGTEPWCTLKRNIDKFGIPKLRIELSKLLTGLVDFSLPQMKQKTEASLSEINQILDTIPAPIGENSKLELLSALRHFATLVTYHINALQNLKVFNQKIRRHYEIFRDAVLATRPKFIHEKPSASLKDTVTSTASQFFWKKPETPSPKTAPLRDPSTSPLTFSLSELRALVNFQKGRELEGYSPYGAFEHLVKKFQGDWRGYATTLITSVNAELANLTSKLTNEVFGRFSFLKGQVNFALQVFQADLGRVCTEHVSHTGKFFCGFLGRFFNYFIYVSIFSCKPF
jgi:hypothetical protein